MLRSLLVLASLAIGCGATPVATGFVLADVVDGSFSTCEIVLNTKWSDFMEQCMPPINTYPWRQVKGGSCHLYETKTIGLRTETNAPYVAICTARGRVRSKSHPLATHDEELIVGIVGLRSIHEWD